MFPADTAEFGSHSPYFNFNVLLLTAHRASSNTPNDFSLHQATLLKPEEMPVPAAKFEEAFGLSWKDALAAGSVYNALDAVS